MNLNKKIQQAANDSIGKIIEPISKRNLASLNILSPIICKDYKIYLTINVDEKLSIDYKKVQQLCSSEFEKIPYVKKYYITISGNKNAKKVFQQPKIKQIILIASGKGGVGKSTITANLAIAAQQSGLTVGVADADISGPSIPHLFGIAEKKPEIIDNRFTPLENHNIQIMSMGFLTPAENALILRGPMISKAINNLINL